MFYCKQCEGCGWNTNKFVNGCESFNEMPEMCSNWISMDNRKKLEHKIKNYPRLAEERRNEIKFVHFNGSSGKYTNKRLTSYGLL